MRNFILKLVYLYNINCVNLDSVGYISNVIKKIILYNYIIVFIKKH